MIWMIVLVAVPLFLLRHCHDINRAFGVSMKYPLSC